MFDEVRVEIEEVQMKELRIVPVTFYKGFNKIVIKAVGPSIHTEPVSADLNVIYKVFTPRDKKYVCRFDQLKCGLYKESRCDCQLCRNKAAGKGCFKDKRRWFVDVCSDN